MAMQGEQRHYFQQIINFMSSSTSSSYADLIRSHYGLIGVALLAMFTGNLGQSFFIGLFQADIMAHLGLSLTQFGSLYAGITMLSGFLVLHFGAKLDWIPPKQYASLVFLALASGLLLLTLSPWLIASLFGLALLRFCGQGLMTHLASTLAAREFQANRGRALGLVSLGMPMGEILLPPLIALAMIWMNWRQIWWILLGLLIICWLIALFRVDWPDAPQNKQQAKQKQQTGQSPTRELRFWLLMPVLMALPIALTGIFIFQAQMTADLGANITTYAIALMAMGLSRFPGALLGGRWVDEFGVAMLARIYLLPFAAGLLIAAIIGGNIGIWLIMLGAGLSLGMQSPIGDSLLVKIWGREFLGRLRSVKSALMVFSTGVTPAIVGLALDGGIHFQAILAGMLIFLLIGWCLALAPIQTASQSTEPSS